MGALAAASLASRPGLTFRSTASQRDTLASRRTLSNCKMRFVSFVVSKTLHSTPGLLPASSSIYIDVIVRRPLRLPLELLELSTRAPLERQPGLRIRSFLARR
jgi:hypothetical protein